MGNVGKLHGRDNEVSCIRFSRLTTVDKGCRAIVCVWLPQLVAKES